MTGPLTLTLSTKGEGSDGVGIRGRRWGYAAWLTGLLSSPIQNPSR